MRMNENCYDELKQIAEKYDVLYSDNLSDLNKLLDGIVLDINSIEYMPKIIISRAMYTLEGSDIIERAKFVIRPTIKYNLSINDMKRCFTLFNTDLFFSKFIDEILNWREEYELYSELEYNLSLLNDKMKSIIATTDFPYSISFSVGDGILDISDNYIVLGLSVEKILDIKNMGFFIEDEYWSGAFIDKFISALKECNRPYDIVKIKSEILKDLGIYNRKSVVNLIRKFVNRSANHVRVGVGYLDDGDYFGIVEKIAVREEDISKYDIDSVIIEDNIYATSLEKKQGLNKIITQYRLSPFEKQTNVLIDKNIKDFYEVLRYRKGGNSDE